MSSAVFTFLGGIANKNFNPFIFGGILGSIFGTGIPIYTYLKTNRIKKTPKSYQGRSSAFLRFVGVFLSIGITFLLGIFERAFKDSVVVYFAAGAFLLAVILILQIIERITDRYC